VKTMIIRPLLFSGLVFSVIGCHTFFRSPKEHRLIGTIDATDVSGPVIQAPSTVHLGEWFDVTVTTRGSSCVRADGADVDVRGLIALITPRDIVNYAHGCLEYDAPYPRTVKVRFDKIGPSIIRVRALNNDDHAVITEHPILVTQAIIRR
jgi:hypothetical protein